MPKHQLNFSNYCYVCGGQDDSLTTDCPGHKIPEEVLEVIREGKRSGIASVDYKDKKLH